MSPRLLNQLAATLRALEGPRQGQVDADASATQALEDLDELRELVAGTDPAGLPDGLGQELDRAREALEASEPERAREILIGVGRAIDDHLRG